MTLLIAFREVTINRFVLLPAPVVPALSVDEDVTTWPRPAAKVPKVSAFLYQTDPSAWR
jgi:hypothetical protein